MKYYALLALCLSVGTAAKAQPSNYSPLRNSLFYSPHVMAAESNMLFQAWSDPYLTIQLNPADAERLRMGRTLANMSWQSAQSEEYLRSRGCEPWQNCAFFSLPPDTLSRPAMVPNFRAGIVHHADRKRFSPVMGLTAQYYSHQIPLASPQLYMSRYAGLPSSSILAGANMRNGGDQRRSGYLLGGFASLRLSRRWETGLRYQFNMYGSNGGIDLMTPARSSSVAPRDVLGTHENVRSNARQHEISAGMVYHAGRSALSAAYTAAFGSGAVRQSDSFFSTVSGQGEFRSDVDLRRHDLYTHLSHQTKPGLVLHWLTRFSQMKSPTESRHQTGYTSASPFASSWAPSDVYEENGRETISDTQNSLESGVGMVAGVQNVTLSAGLFVGRVSMDILVDNLRLSYSRNGFTDEATGQHGYTEHEARLHRSLQERHTMDFASLPLQAAFRVSKHAEMSAGTELFLRWEHSRVQADMPNGLQSENSGDRRFDQSLYFGARISPDENWELNLRWLPLQRPDFGPSTFATNRVMVSLTRAW